MTPYYQSDNGVLYHGDCLTIMPHLEPVDLVVTSPPYDTLREYNGFVFNFHKTAWQIKQILSCGGICVWIVSDETKNGSETGTSFKQALFFKAIGLWLYDTMVWSKPCITTPTEGRYYNTFEYMFVLSKGKPKTINFIKDRINITAGGKRRSLKNCRKEGRKTGGKEFTTSRYGRRYNVWDINPYSKPNGHPAIFPVGLAKDHIVSWTNEKDIVLDPMCGSGTTPVACEQLCRKWIGIEISEKYCEIAAKRIEAETRQLKLF